MKRPLFCLGMAFALGEAMYIYTDKVVLPGAVFAALICSAIYVRVHKRMLGVYVFFAGVLLGVLHAFCFSLQVVEADHEIVVDAWIDEMSMGARTGKMTVEFCDFRGKATVLGVDVSNYKIGDCVRIQGVLQPYEEGSNPGEFNQRIYYLSRNVIGYFYDVKIEKKDVGKRPPLKYRCKNNLDFIRNKLKAQIECITDSPYEGLYQSILLGEKDNLDKDLKKMYQSSGMAHILVISGLHISLIAGIAYKFFRRCHLKFMSSGMIAIMVVLFYGAMTGFGMATVRAVVMIGIFMLSEILGDCYDTPTAMTVALVYMLIVRPERLLDGGVHLSFGAIFGVCLGQYIIRQLRKQEKYRKFRKKHKLGFYLCNSIIAAASIAVVMAPILASVYYEIPTYSFFVNLLVVPTMTIVVFVGILAVGISFFSIPFARVVIKPGLVCLKMYSTIGKLSLKIPGCYIRTGRVSFLQILTYYACIFVIILWFRPKLQRKCREYIYHKTGYWLQKNVWKYVILSVCMAVMGLLFSAELFLYKQDCYETLMVLDVGQGQGILLRGSEGENCVFDGGSVTRSALGEYTLIPALKYMHMSRVDYWFVSHTDEDHISGLMYILKEGKKCGITIQNLVVSKNQGLELSDREWKELVELAQQNGISVLTMEAGDCLRGENNIITCLHPDAEYIGQMTEPDKNTYSLSVSYVSSEMKVLILGDADTPAIEYMLGKHRSLFEEAYDVLILPHHGSKYSIHSELYGLLHQNHKKGQRGVAICSCGKNNRYGHPHKEVLFELEKQGITLYRTDIDGAVELRRE